VATSSILPSKTQVPFRTTRKALGWTWAETDLESSHDVPCPKCGAPAGMRCRAKGRDATYTHHARYRISVPAGPVIHPNLVLWWKDHPDAKPRPTNYLVPDNAEIMRGEP
jgi:hypothetical protein